MIDKQTKFEAKLDNRKYISDIGYDKNAKSKLSAVLPVYKYY